MIRRILKYRLLPWAFLLGVPEFLRQYLQTRTVRYLLIGLPGALISICICAVWLSGGSIRNAELLDWYEILTSKEIEAGNFEAAEVYFTRQLQLTTHRPKTIFSYAKQLWKASGGPKEDRWHLLVDGGSASPDLPAVRSLQLMESIAPREVGLKGYPDAHRFLASYWKTRNTQNDLSRGLVLQHASASDPQDLSAALKLARFLSRSGHHEPAIHVLNPFHAEPTAKMAMSGFMTLDGELRTGRRLLSEAVTELTRRLQNEPDNVNLRLQLSRAQAGQREYLQSMLVLADGCSSHEPSSILVDALIHRCILWLQNLPPDSVDQQLQQLSSLLGKTDDATEADLVFSSGETVTLPTPLVRLHEALVAGEGQWIVPLLIGTDLAARERYWDAKARLSEALAARPDQCHAMNNLAWVCYKLVEESKQGNDTEVETAATSALINRAWDLANRAVQARPAMLSFRQTRAAVALNLRKWQVASADLSECIAGGYDMDNSRLLLAEAQQKMKSNALPGSL